MHSADEWCQDRTPQTGLSINFIVRPEINSINMHCALLEKFKWSTFTGKICEEYFWVHRFDYVWLCGDSMLGLFWLD